MATFKIANAISAGFPVGTAVKCYLQKGPQPGVPSSGPPPGTSIEEPTVGSEGQLEYTGLTEGNWYLLAAEVSSVWHYLHIYVPFAGEVVAVASQATGDFAVMTAGKGFKVKEGANAKMGKSTLVAGKVVVANTSVTSSSRIFVQRTGAGAGAHPGPLAIVDQKAGVSFTVENTASNEDTDEVNWIIFEPA